MYIYEFTIMNYNNKNECYHVDCIANFTDCELIDIIVVRCFVSNHTNY